MFLHILYSASLFTVLVFKIFRRVFVFFRRTFLYLVLSTDKNVLIWFLFSGNIYCTVKEKLEETYYKNDWNILISSHVTSRNFCLGRDRVNLLIYGTDRPYFKQKQKNNIINNENQEAFITESQKCHQFGIKYF